MPRSLRCKAKWTSAAQIAGYQAFLDAAARSAMLDAMLAAEPPADPPPRPETGPMRFGDDWAGVFLRGDYAGPMAMYLRAMLKREENDGSSDALVRHALQGLAETLSECDERGDLAGLQRMRPFAECMAGKVPAPKSCPSAAE